MDVRRPAAIFRDRSDASEYFSAPDALAYFQSAKRFFRKMTV